MRLIAFVQVPLTLICSVAIAETTRPSSRPDAAPEPRRVWLAGTLPAEIKARRVKSGHLMVKPSINGQELAAFIFDTGAGMSCVDGKVAAKLKLPGAGETTALGTGGQQSTRFCGIRILALGPLLVEDSTVVELNLLPIGLAIGEQLDGIIGYECFLPAVFEIDVANAKIVVNDPKTYTLPSGATWRELLINDRRPFVRGRIEGKEEGLFLLDTGATGSLTIESRAVKALRLLEDRETGGSRFGGVGGIHAARSGKLRKFEFAGQQLEEVEAIFAQSDKGDSKDPKVQGTIGLDLLAKYKLILDYPNKRVALIRQ